MPVRVGFVGSGGIAGAHMNALAQVENAQLVAFCDVAAERAENAARRFNATAYTDFRAMFDREQLDAVYVCLPPFAHGEPEIEAATRGIALFVEKPIAIDMGVAREIESAIQRAGVVNAVGYHWRYYDLTDYVRDLLETRTIGMVMGYWTGGLPGTPWWRVMEQSGGQMLEQTTHIVDLARYLVGEVETVYSAYALRALGDTPNLNVPDVGTSTLRFANGAIGHIANACMLPTGYLTGLNVLTRDMILEVRGGNVKVIEGDRTEERRTRTNPTLVEDQLFIDAVEAKDGAKIRSTYSDALRSMAVSLACNLSAERREPVELKEVLGE